MKNKTLLLARLQVRSETPDGGAIPDDEMQCEFIITTGDLDGHGSVMTEKTMRNYTEDAERGVPFMLDHGEGLDRQLGRTIAAEYDETEKQVRATISILRDTEQTPENMRVDEYIRRMERGFYDSASVAFRDATETCNICNRAIFDYNTDDPCPHIPKQTYNGEVCTYNVDDARLRHVALVTSPSNPNAKMLDHRSWDEELRKVKQEGDVGTPGVNNQKSILERDGEKYRASIIDDAIKAGIRAEDSFDEQAWRRRFATRDAEEIIAQTETWDKLGDARWGTGGRTTQTTPGAKAPQGQRTIFIPGSYFEV